MRCRLQAATSTLLATVGGRFVAEFANSPLLAGAVVQLLAFLLASAGLWWRNRQRHRDRAETHHLIMKQISEEISVIAAWINAYRLVAPDDARHAGYARACGDLEHAYARLIETRDLQQTVQPLLNSAQPTQPPAQPTQPPAQPTQPPAQPPWWQSPAPPAPPAPSPVRPSKAAITSLWTLALVALLLAPYGGIVTIIYLIRFRISLNRGDETSAWKFYSRAKIWLWISLGLFIIIIVVAAITAANTPPSHG